MDIEAFPTRPKKVELRVCGIADLLLGADRWYESAVRYILGRPGWSDEHPATRRARKQVATASMIITPWFNSIPWESVAKSLYTRG